MVDPRNIIGALKAYIQEEKGISFKKQRILSEDGEDLNDAQTLFSLGIKKGSTLILRYAPIAQISVRLLMSCSIVKDPWSLGRSMQIIIHDDSYKDQIKGRSFLKTFVLKYGPKDTISGTIKDCRISYTLMVEPNDTIAAVKAYIQEQIGFSFKNQKLLSKGAVLSDPQTLASLGIRKGSSLILRFAIEFVVKVTHAPMGCIYIKLKRGDTVGDVKAALQEKIGLRFHNQSLLSQGRILANDDQRIVDLII
ncbi:hypothetical protein KY290_008688 [Solanum tuberosum]|uniref:Ubiquitin-like domain-containing protein n=1 Tax=Solanum tuberosum TaxID=4113 RepID=A0ABQ7W950_SOLTU|nr:hypothetical protein KY290_008688 [Solanum tuberosum]